MYIYIYICTHLWGAAAPGLGLGARAMESYWRMVSYSIV